MKATGVKKHIGKKQQHVFELIYKGALVGLPYILFQSICVHTTLRINSDISTKQH